MLQQVKRWNFQIKKALKYFDTSTQSGCGNHNIDCGRYVHAYLWSVWPDYAIIESSWRQMRNFLTKVVQIFGYFGLLKTITFKVKTTEHTIWATFWKFGLLCSLTSVHIVCGSSYKPVGRKCKFSRFTTCLNYQESATWKETKNFIENFCLKSTISSDFWPGPGIRTTFNLFVNSVIKYWQPRQMLPKILKLFCIDWLPYSVDVLW